MYQIKKMQIERERGRMRERESPSSESSGIVQQKMYIDFLGKFCYEYRQNCKKRIKTKMSNGHSFLCVCVFRQVTIANNDKRQNLKKKVQRLVYPRNNVLYA